MRRLFSLVLIAMFFVTGCKQDTALYDEVMFIHDDVMPKMRDIHSNKKQLQAQLDSIQNDSIRTIILNQLSQLKKADDAMMDWMAAFSIENMDADQQKTYLLSQKDSIIMVRDLMLGSIADSEKLLAELKQSKTPNTK